jgi:hypothetical protein
VICCARLKNSPSPERFYMLKKLIFSLFVTGSLLLSNHSVQAMADKPWKNTPLRKTNTDWYTYTGEHALNPEKMLKIQQLIDELAYIQLQFKQADLELELKKTLCTRHNELVTKAKAKLKEAKAILFTDKDRQLLFIDKKYKNLTEEFWGKIDTRVSFNFFDSSFWQVKGYIRNIHANYQKKLSVNQPLNPLKWLEDVLTDGLPEWFDRLEEILLAP